MSNSKSASRNTLKPDYSPLHRGLITELEAVKHSLGRKPSDETLNRAIDQAKTAQLKLAMAATLLTPFDHEPELALLTDLVNRAHPPKRVHEADGGFPMGTEKYLRVSLNAAITELSRAELLLQDLNAVAANLGYALDVIHHARIYEALNRHPVDPLALTVIADQAMRWNANVSPLAEAFVNCLSPAAHV